MRLAAANVTRNVSSATFKGHGSGIQYYYYVRRFAAKLNCLEEEKYASPDSPGHR